MSKNKMSIFNATIWFSLYTLADAILQPQQNRNTIFDDEKLEGGPFQYLDSSKQILVAEDVSSYRLPTTTRPSHYDILWMVNLTNLSFSGEVDIYLYATEENVNEITIHAHDLNITSMNLFEENTEVYQTYTLQPEYHFIKVLLTSGFLKFNSTTPVIYKLSIGFEAPLRTDMLGLYSTWYRNNATDEVSWMATTLFAPSAARFAFPCYDEPSFKATFQVTVRRPVGYRSWSCTRQRVTGNKTNFDYEEDKYHTTPVMSTYLLALVVAQYKTQDLVENGSLMYEVIGRPSVIESGQSNYTFNVGQKLLDEMSIYTDIDFYSVHPDIKMTQAAIPDFSAGAMENWGLLAYREAYLMYDESHTSLHFKQIIAYIVAHEITHMWFGNLVTCDWWSELWLNEGFARYYQYFLTRLVEDYMEFPTRFVPEQVHTSLLSDSADNPHPLTNPNVGSPASVDAMFSTISYNKGSCIIRMTEHLLGSDVHKEGLRRYLKNRYLDNALPIHLFQILHDTAEETSAIAEYGPDFNVIDYYRSWTEQGGHPVLKIEINHNTGEMIISQLRFNINRGYTTADRNWIIPITFSTASQPDFYNTKPTHILRDTVTVINRTSIGDEWVVFNKQQTGYYRIYYDDYTWDLITNFLHGDDRNMIHHLNRAQIIDDVFQFARSGIMTYTKALNIISFLIYETDYAPWISTISGFNWISNRFAGTDIGSRLNNLFKTWATSVMFRLTYYPTTGEPFLDTYLRYHLAPVMCRFEDPLCLEAAQEQFLNLKNNLTEVPVDSRNWVYCAGLRNGSIDDFQYLWNRFLQHNVYSEKILLLQVLGCTPHEQALYTLMDAIIEDNYVIRPQDYTTALNSAVTGNEGNTQIVFRYIQSNLPAVISTFGSATTPLSYISSRLRNFEEVEEFRRWVNASQADLGASHQAVYNSADTSYSAIEWAIEVQDDIKNYLDFGNSLLQTSTSPSPTTDDEVVVTIFPTDEPTTPDFDNSALNFHLSMFSILLAFILNIVM